jgi:NADH:ubiquinone reductase (non-electrogenic)
MDDICERYPQVELYLKNKQMHGIADLLKESKGDVKKESIELNIEELKTALINVDSEMKFLPATAQVRVILFSYSILFNGILLL